MPTVTVKRLNATAVMPTRMSHAAACWDVRSSEELTIEPGEVGKVPTGLAFDIPAGWELVVRSRSGLASRGIIVANSPGTVDSDYTGELFVLLLNTGDHSAIVFTGDRIAQITLAQTPSITFIEGEIIKLTARGENGFGSTGTR